MDEIDEWMSRVDEKLEEVSSIKSSKKDHPKRKKTFSKKKTQVKPKRHVNKHVQKHTKPHPQKRQSRGASPILKGKVKIIPLGGLGEVGKNLMAIEYEKDIIVVDMGFEFPSDDLLGIDYVIPDTTYLEENKKRIRAVFITHGHLDHIGGIPYILPKLDFPPVYSLKLTIGFIKRRIEEFNQQKFAKLNAVNPGETIKAGRLAVKFLRVAHSVPDSAALVIDTPAGKLVHTGDFKFDENPAGLQKKASTQELAALGRQNVLGLFSDSTNSLEEGHTMSEQQVGESLEKIFRNTKGRLIIASFSSLVSRLQQIINLAQKYNRKVFVSGKSMQQTMKIAVDLGYLKYPAEYVKDIKKYKKVPDKEALIITTGSQGESLSALTKISLGTHKYIKVQKGDTIVFSSSPIIGNERAIYNVVNNLCMLGAEVIHNQIMDVHTSGHAKQDEQKKMIDLVKPKYFIPIHGEYFMRQAHARLAENKCGIPKSHIVLMQNGDVLLGEKGKLEKSKETVDAKHILIDGRGEGQMDSNMQLERRIMSQNGALVVLIYISKRTKKLGKDPDVVTRGFVYMHESEEITAEVIQLAKDAYKRIHGKNPKASRHEIKKYIKQTIDKHTESKLARRPLIIPLIIET